MFPFSRLCSSARTTGLLCRVHALRVHAQVAVTDLVSRVAAALPMQCVLHNAEDINDATVLSRLIIPFFPKCMCYVCAGRMRCACTRPFL